MLVKKGKEEYSDGKLQALWAPELDLPFSTPGAFSSSDVASLGRAGY